MSEATVLERLASAPAFTHGPGCTDDQVAALEKFAGGPLPESYRQFLARYGCAIWDSGTIYGCYELGSLLSPSYDLDAARQTDETRRDAIEGCFTPAAKSGLVLSQYD